MWQLKQFKTRIDSISPNNEKYVREKSVKKKVYFKFGKWKVNDVSRQWVNLYKKQSTQCSKTVSG